MGVSQKRREHRAKRLALKKACRGWRGVSPAIYTVSVAAEPGAKAKDLPRFTPEYHEAKLEPGQGFETSDGRGLRRAPGREPATRGAGEDLEEGVGSGGGRRGAAPQGSALMPRQRPLLAAVPPPPKAPRKAKARRSPILNRDSSPERIAELRARLEAADNARPLPALRQEGPEHISLGRRELVIYDLLDMAPLALRGGESVAKGRAGRDGLEEREG